MKGTEQRDDTDILNQFEWCFKPIFVWIHLVTGINLIPSDQSESTKGRVFFTFFSATYGYFLLVFAISVNILSMVFFLKTTTIKNFKEEGINVTQANLMISYITAINDATESFTIYLVFYSFVLMGKWKSLWLVLKQIERQHPQLNRDCYHQCRKYALIGLGFFLLVNQY